MSDPSRDPIPPEVFAKADQEPDVVFYGLPRFVTHIDDKAIAAVTQLYREVFPAGGVVLDLMGGWVSHLPDDVAYETVIGHGMNAEELAANPRYSRHFRQDLNEDQILPLEDASIHGVGICVSVQYLQYPIAVYSELRRVLRLGGVLAITMSNRCFPTKAIALWHSVGPEQRMLFVTHCLERAGFSEIARQSLIHEGMGQDPLWAVVARRD